MDHLLAARRSLRETLDSSRALDAALEGTSPRLAGVRRRLPSLEASVRPALAIGAALAAAAGHIDRAVGPAAAVLRVFDAVHGLEPSLLSGPGDDLGGYLAIVRRLEEALRFLADNCSLAVRWLEDVAEFLERNSVADGKYIAAFRASLQSLKGHSSASLDGGLLGAALDRLESEYLCLLSSNSTPLPINLLDASSDQVITPSPLPVPVIQKLQAVLQRLAENNRPDRAVSIYAEIRGSNVRESLRALDLDYLEISSSDASDVQSIEEHIVQWGKHLEFAVKHIFEPEFKLCSDVFERFGPAEVVRECFADIVMKAGFQVFLQFGKTVVETKKDPIKLLKLLDVFAHLSNLRPDFNRLFGGKACAEIQSLTRDLIKRLVEEACEIFWELLVQVELQRRTPPSPNGAIPKLVDFITDYCNRLLSEEYRPVLNQILYIHQSWKREKHDGRLLTDTVQDIIRALEQNFDAWANSYEDAAQAHLFMMNIHGHLHNRSAGTLLGEALGEAWLKELEQYKEYYAAMYMRESWGRLPALLSREGLILFSGGRATARDLVKRRLREFNSAFDEAYRRQSGWVVADGELRERTCQLAVQAIVPVYRSYMQSYGALVEQDPGAGKCAKYSPQALERMLCSLFQSKNGRSASFAGRHSSGSFSSVVTSQYKSAPTAV